MTNDKYHKITKLVRGGRILILKMTFNSVSEDFKKYQRKNIQKNF